MESSEKALEFANRRTRTDLYNEFEGAWLRMLAQTFLAKIRLMLH